MFAVTKKRIYKLKRMGVKQRSGTGSRVPCLGSDDSHKLSVSKFNALLNAAAEIISHQQDGTNETNQQFRKPKFGNALARSLAHSYGLITITQYATLVHSLNSFGRDCHHRRDSGLAWSIGRQNPLWCACLPHRFPANNHLPILLASSGVTIASG